MQPISRCSRPGKPRRRAFNAIYVLGSLSVVDPVGASPTEIALMNSSAVKGLAEQSGTGTPKVKPL
jgi:hypothetical protein